MHTLTRVSTLWKTNNESLFVGSFFSVEINDDIFTSNLDFLLDFRDISNFGDMYVHRNLYISAMSQVSTTL